MEDIFDLLLLRGAIIELCFLITIALWFFFIQNTGIRKFFLIFQYICYISFLVVFFAVFDWYITLPLWIGGYFIMRWLEKSTNKEIKKEELKGVTSSKFSERKKERICFERKTEQEQKKKREEVEKKEFKKINFFIIYGISFGIVAVLIIIKIFCKI